MSADERHDREQALARLERENELLRAELAEARALLAHPTASHTIHGLLTMVVQLDDEGRVVYINSATEAHIRRKRHEVYRQPLHSVDRTRLGVGYLHLLYQQSLKEGREISTEQSYPDPLSGELRFVQVTVSPLENGTQILIEDQSRFKQMEGMFKRYVSPKVIDRLLASGVDYNVPERYELTVLFADLRGFTRLCTRLAPEDVKRIIDRFLGVMTKIIIDADATVDKFVGDEVMALFGAPIRVPDHVTKALNVALAMQEAHKLVMEEWRGSGLENPPGLGVGINTGEMIVGNIGSPLRMDYTALGHEVNLAARLCSQAKAGEILIGPYSFSLARKYLENHPNAMSRSVKFRSTQEIFVKGIDAPVNPISVVAVR